MSRKPKKANPNPDDYAVRFAGRRRVEAAAGMWLPENVSPDARRSDDTVRMYDHDRIGWLLKRKTITLEQWAAATRLYGDWYKAGFAASNVVDPARDYVDVSRTAAVPPVQMEHARLYHRALQAVGMIHSQPLTAIVIENADLADYGLRRYHWRDRRSAEIATTAALRDALDALTAYYRDGTGRRQDVE